jgi:hypothetical protein
MVHLSEGMLKPVCGSIYASSPYTSKITAALPDVAVDSRSSHSPRTAKD